MVQREEGGDHMGFADGFIRFVNAIKGNVKYEPELLYACNDEDEKTQRHLIRHQTVVKIINRIAFAIMVCYTMWVIYG